MAERFRFICFTFLFIVEMSIAFIVPERNGAAIENVPENIKPYLNESKESSYTDGSFEIIPALHPRPAVHIREYAICDCCLFGSVAIHLCAIGA